MPIKILGLGPGDAKYLTREAWELLTTSTAPIYLRTRLHPTLTDIPNADQFHDFDAIYAQEESFEAVYQKIAATIIDLGREQTVIYAVPGHPLVAETAVSAITHQADAQSIEVEIIAGLSFIEPTLTALKLDGLDNLQLFDAADIAQYLHAPVNADAPLLLGQIYSKQIASDLKLALQAVYPPETTVTLIHSAGNADQLIETVALFEIDRSDHIGNLSALYMPPRDTLSSLPHFAETVAYLRSPNGCPWDREQTSQTMRTGLLEEASEVLDAIDAGDTDNLREELGDLLLHIVFQAQLASEASDFTLSDVIAGIDAKIKRRHPHVWGEVAVSGTGEVLQNWEEIKRAEKGNAPESVLGTVPNALPALSRSQKVQEKAAKVGYDWPNIEGVWEKLFEEIEELKQAETAGERAEELGDMLFVMVNLGRWLGVDAEIALREATLKFSQRFQMVETIMGERGEGFGDQDFARLISLWQEAKSRLK